MNLRAIRGAITVDANERDAILDGTEELVRELMERNSLDSKQIVSCIFTCTPDLTAAFPAEAARNVGLNAVPLLCAQEIDVPGSLPRVIRLMAHCYGDDASPPQHVYLREAVGLRRDLEARVGLRLARRREHHLGEPVHAPRLLPLDPVGRVEVLQLAGEMDGKLVRVELLDLCGAGLAGDEAAPRGLDVVAQWRDHAEAGHDDPPSPVPAHVTHIPSPPSTSSTSPVMNEAASEQRKRTAPATSSGSPSRPSGVFCSIAAVASSGKTSVSCVLT